MPGSGEACGRGWSGREPWVVIAARALAPWPLWLVLWAPFRTDARLGSPFVFVGVALWVVWMARRATRRSTRPVGLEPMLLVMSLVVGATVFLSMISEVLFLDGRSQAPGWLPRAALTWLGGAALYELCKRLLAQPATEPPPAAAGAVDLVAHHLLFLAPVTGLVDLWADSAPLPLLVGPLVAIRVGGRQEAWLPRPRAGRLSTRTVLGAAAAVVLLGVVLTPTDVAPVRSAAVHSIVLAAAVSALLAAITLAVRAGGAARGLSGVVRDLRPGGVVLARAGGARVHVIPSEPQPAAGVPGPRVPVTFLDVHPVAAEEVPYRSGPPLFRARVAWAGTAEELAETLLCRAWGWLAWSALGFAAAILLLG